MIRNDTLELFFHLSLEPSLHLRLHLLLAYYFELLNDRQSALQVDMPARCTFGTHESLVNSHLESVRPNNVSRIEVHCTL
jgi:hypothetical protein